MEEKISLYELQEKVKRAVDHLSQGSVWVTAEISEIKGNASGHWYLELADYNEKERVLAAKARAMIWSRSAAMLMPFFESTAGAPLSAGMHVLLKVQVQYSVIYGLSLNVLDIDPSYTVGELEMNRQRVIRQLQQEGMFGLNSSVEMPLLPKRIAVISSETAAGYRDFRKHLQKNEYGFGFEAELFSAPMQGVDAPAGIIAALDNVMEKLSRGEHYDAVVLIRGGGGALELACFDDYELALNIAQFPLPVLTGIGHDHDFHVADMVAYAYFKTPTAVAGYLIDLHLQQAERIESLYRRASAALMHCINNNLNALQRCSDRLENSVRRVIYDEYNRLKMIEYKVQAHDPMQILNKGFAIVVDGGGNRISSVSAMASGDVVKLLMKDGEVELSVLKVKK